MRLFLKFGSNSSARMRPFFGGPIHWLGIRRISFLSGLQDRFPKSGSFYRNNLRTWLLFGLCSICLLGLGGFREVRLSVVQGALNAVTADAPARRLVFAYGPIAKKGYGTKHSYCQGFISFDAKFAGFATRMHLSHTKLYVVKASPDIIRAIQNQGIACSFHEEIHAKAYQVPRFTVYVQGYATIGSSPGRRLIAKDPFKLQLSETLGDYTTPAFDHLEKNRYTGANSWEASGNILSVQQITGKAATAALASATGSFPLKVTELYFKDYDIRLK